MTLLMSLVQQQLGLHRIQSNEPYNVAEKLKQSLNQLYARFTKLFIRVCANFLHSMPKLALICRNNFLFDLDLSKP